MGAIKGLAAIRAFNESRAAAAKEREERSKAPKIKYLSLTDGQNVTIRFLQELDTESENYDPNRGVGTGIVEHVVWKPSERQMLRASCSMDLEGKCYGCEMLRAGDKAYAQKSNYYINALVDLMDGSAPEVMILSRGMGSTFFTALIEEAEDEGSITGINYKVGRRGTGTDTTWILKGLKTDPLDDSEVELYDIDKGVVRNYPYVATDTQVSQEDFYNGKTYQKAEEKSADSYTKPASSATDMDASW
jgi:hypothetical protein